MKFFQDEVSETHYAIFDGASDAARGVVETVDLESTEVAGSVDMETSGDFIGRRFLNWRDAVNEARDKSWDDGVKELNRMCKELETIEFPELKGRGRKREANDDGDGDINFEKFFAGESKIFETNKSGRGRRHSTYNHPVLRRVSPLDSWVAGHPVERSGRDSVDSVTRIERVSR